MIARPFYLHSFTLAFFPSFVAPSFLYLTPSLTPHSFFLLCNLSHVYLSFLLSFYTSCPTFPFFNTVLINPSPRTISFPLHLLLSPHLSFPHTLVATCRGVTAPRVFLIGLLFSLSATPRDTFQSNVTCCI